MPDTLPILPAQQAAVPGPDRSVQARIDACHEQYILHFVGQPRLTRDVAMLDSLIGELTPMLEQLPISEHAMRKELGERLADYNTERHAIVTSQERAGPQGRAAAHLKLRVGFVMHRYVRHFAGQPRATRDLGLLQEIIADLGLLVAPVKHLARLEENSGHGAQESAAALVKVLAALQQSQGHLAAEAEAIAALRRPNKGPVQEAQARSDALTLAQAANTVFAAYQGLVIDRPRLVVRPELIGRLARALADLHGAMQGLMDAGWEDAGHKENCVIMADHHRTWLEEQQETLRVRRQHTMDEIAHALVAEADVILGEYNQTIAGQQLVAERRGSLIVLCDRMDELQRQMQGVPQAPGHQHHEHNAWVLTDALSMLNATFDGAHT